MLSKEDLIESAFGIPYEEMQGVYNSEYFVFVSVMKQKFPNYDISKEKNDFIDDGTRFRPKKLRGISNNNKWKCSLYHQQEKHQKCPFVNGRYYHIGFMNYDGSFGYQGIRQFNDGFKDDNGYWLKPFPTHFIEIEKPLDAVFH